MLIVIKWVFLALLAALQVGDGMTTARVLAQGGRELNFAMAVLMANLGRAGGLAVKGTFVVAIGLVFMLNLPSLIAIIALAIMCTAYAFAVVHNWRQIR